MPIFKRLLGNFLIFTTFPPEDSLGLFVCYEGHIQDVKTAKIVFVAICLRLTPFFHKMPVGPTIYPSEIQASRAIGPILARRSFDLDVGLWVAWLMHAQCHISHSNTSSDCLHV